MFGYSLPSFEVVKRRRVGKKFPVSQAELSAIAAASDVPIKRLPPGPAPVQVMFVRSHDGRVPVPKSYSVSVARDLFSFAMANAMPRFRNGASPL